MKTTDVTEDTIRSDERHVKRVFNAPYRLFQYKTKLEAPAPKGYDYTRPRHDISALR